MIHDQMIKINILYHYAIYKKDPYIIQTIYQIYETLHKKRLN